MFIAHGFTVVFAWIFIGQTGFRTHRRYDDFIRNFCLDMGIQLWYYSRGSLTCNKGFIDSSNRRFIEVF